MPTVEIASIQSSGLGLNQADFDIAIIEENKLISHRSLFYDFLRKQKGVIIHIGNPDFKQDKNRGFYAGGIIDWSVDENKYIIIPEYDLDEALLHKGADQQSIFKFLGLYKSDMDQLLKIALDHSPVKKVYFLTDYQFGPLKGTIEKIGTISDFWIRHDYEGLKLNTLYEMYDF